MPRADLVIYNRDGQIAAVAEVKNKLGTSGEWAAKMRRNILAHGGFPAIDFFLLATPDRLYLWKMSGSEPLQVQPTYEIDAQSIFQPYLQSVEVDSRIVSARAFELVVAAWLVDVIRSGGPPEKRTDDQRWLLESGFWNAVKDGRVEYEVAA